MSKKSYHSEEVPTRNEVVIGFEGFPAPEKNYYPMPNSFTNVCAEIESLAELKVILYILRHTWGYQEYGVHKTISIDEFMHGRKRKDGTRIDQGTGLSDRGVKNGIALAIKHGYITCEIDDHDKARIKKYYALKMSAHQSNVEGNIIPPSDRNNVPPDRNIIPPDGKIVPIHQEQSSHRSEKETLEKHLEKNTRRSSDTQVPSIEQTAAPDVFVLGNVTEEEVALIRVHRQRSLDTGEELSLSQNLGGEASGQKSKQAEDVTQSADCTSGTQETVPLIKPTQVATPEEVVQVWESVRQVAYEGQERTHQLRAAQTLIQLELPQSLSVALLEELYQTYYDPFWKRTYGELHLTHLVEREKSSGQIRIIRWIKRLGFQSLPTGTKEVSGEVSGEERAAPPAFKPTMDFAHYPQGEVRDPIKEYAEGRISEEELTTKYTPTMRAVIKRRAAAYLAERAVAAGGGV